MLQQMIIIMTFSAINQPSFWCYFAFKVTGTHIYLEITVTRFMQPMLILTLPSTKLFLGLNLFSLAHTL